VVAALVVAGIAVASSRSASCASPSFEALMMAAGDLADHARAMFDESVTVVLDALAVAAVVALVLAAIFGRMLARPIQHVAWRRSGSRPAISRPASPRGSGRGPGPAAAYNTMADRPRSRR
jgi:hypothetical protein